MSCGWEMSKKLEPSQILVCTLKNLFCYANCWTEWRNIYITNALKVSPIGTGHGFLPVFHWPLNWPPYTQIWWPQPAPHTQCPWTQSPGTHPSSEHWSEHSPRMSAWTGCWFSGPAPLTWLQIYHPPWLFEIWKIRNLHKNKLIRVARTWF